MQQRVMNILTQIKDRWTALGRGKQIRFVSAAVVLALALAATIFFLTRPQMVVIEANMEPQQLSQALSILQDNGINAQVANNTTALSVPKASVDAARLLLATNDIQTSDITYADALNLGIGTPESTRNMVDVRAKETQLSTALKMIRNVKDAVVHLEIPNVTPFILRERDMPTASVMLDTSSDFSQAEIEGIADFVAKSVANLEPENISIVDTNGRSLFSVDPSGIGGMSRQQELESAKKYEIENQVRQLLAPQFDLVDVAAQLDWDWTGSTTSTTTYTNPIAESSTGFPTRQTLSESNVENSEPAAEPGAQSNTGQTPQYPTGTGTASTATQSQSDTDYIYNTEQTQTSLPASGRWSPENSSLAVLAYINRYYKEDDLRASGALDNTTWEDFKTDKLNSTVIIDPTANPALNNAPNSVRAATGIQNVEIFGYERPIFVDSEVTARPINQLLMAGLLLLIIGLLAFGLIRRTQPVEIEEIEPELLVEDMLVSSEAQHAAEEPVPEIDYFAESELKKQIDKFVEEKPEAAAQLLRNWLSEEWE